MRQLIIFIALTAFLAAGCKPKSSASSSENPAAKTFDAHGIVRQITPDRRTATIQHEAIPGYMAAMTMDFKVKDTNEVTGISPDDEITFKLAVTETDEWIEHIRFLAHHIGEVTNNTFVFHIPAAELKPGDALPDGELTAEDGSKIHFSNFRGRAVAFTFFFTSCPLPDYCPRMNKNFAEARKILLADSNAPANWQFLSVSFDLNFDTPQMLTGYASLYRGTDTNRWLFAVAPTNTLARLAPPLDLMVVRDGVSFTHNLRTVVLDPQGRVARQFDGNGWTPQQLADALRDAARGKNQMAPP